MSNLVGNPEDRFSHDATNLFPAVLYRKSQTKTSAMSALAGFAVGGDAIRKPMVWEPVKNDHVVQVNTESAGMLLMM